MKTSRAQLAAAALRIRQAGFYKLGNDAMDTLCLVLDRYGERGISIPDDEEDGAYVPYAEPNPGEFVKIDRIRYYGALQVRAEKQWIDYENAMTDTWFMLDTLIGILEAKED